MVDTRGARLLGAGDAQHGRFYDVTYRHPNYPAGVRRPIELPRGMTEPGMMAAARRAIAAVDHVQAGDIEILDMYPVDAPGGVR